MNEYTLKLTYEEAVLLRVLLKYCDDNNIPSDQSDTLYACDVFINGAEVDEDKAGDALRDMLTKIRTMLRPAAA
jgi:hypothetical protein